jgi:hypothetical protein
MGFQLHYPLSCIQRSKKALEDQPEHILRGEKMMARWRIMQRATQDNIQATTAKPGLQKGVDKAQAIIGKQALLAGVGLTKAQKMLGDTLEDVQDSIQNGMQITKNRTFGALGKGKAKATDKLAKATNNVKVIKDSMQDRYEQYMRKRKRARRLFRWGLIIGLVLALLYTPKPGAELRSQLQEQWQHYRTCLGI